MTCMNRDNIQQPTGIPRKPVAEFNCSPRWPDGYFEALLEAKIPSRQHSFYAHWVRQFFNQNPGKARRSLGAEDIARFLGTLKTDPNMAHWQIRQAQDALILYYEQFRGIPLGDISIFDNPPSEKQSSSTQTPSSIPAVRKVESIDQVPAPSDSPLSQRADMKALRELTKGVRHL